ncbi:Acetyl-/propionyl-coenzyme A carboxylase alpha chain [Tepidimonas taiwanensis]|uniref:Acetyl-/propionyl-coenzyme A carboxylase alpha chain n=2 Tax=Tepidimonas taiwanensis TaxID=307486 RepID=A0A554XCN0_9BURK|nr:Acetyl-/propionyl-coenzyme A carboxylase alpha chain [Tepidimonas taiwanensis]
MRDGPPALKMFQRVLIGNRGAIACRIIRTLRRMGVQSVAVYSEADRHSMHVRLAEEAVEIGPAPAAHSYLRVDKILEAAIATGAEAIHPGYGFLSENPGFAEACAAAGIAFIGPTPAQMRAFGLKHTARALAAQNGVPLLPGSGLLTDAGHAQAEAARIGYPVMLKSTAGGGGIGMRLVWSADELKEAFESVDRLARANFKEAGLFLEKYVEHARHIEVQIFGDGKGYVVALGERDCSVQRRNQKVIEETPAPGLTDAQRKNLLATAVRLGEAVGYRSAGTVEFVCDAMSGEFYFLEVNTRLQVEHGVTEEVTGVDLVEWMVREAAGELDLSNFEVSPQGSSIQVRLYAEDPAKDFQPSSGVLTEVVFPTDARVETWVERGAEVPPFYDPMLAKLIVKGRDRAEALAKLTQALAGTRVAGIETNLDYLRQVVADAVFAEGRQTTRYLNAFRYRPATIEVIEPGVQSSVQDWPGRMGYWDVGVPPSGPMDPLAFRVANRLVGNAEGTAGLELTLAGPTLRFHCDAVIALAGAEMGATLDGRPLANWAAHAVKAGSILKLGAVQGAGCRAYLAVRGGLDVPDYLGSKSTFTLGQFGGHAGRTLRVGDVLHITRASDAPAASLPADLIPTYTHAWEIGVLYGPHGAPDFFTDADIEMFFATDWEVHYNSSRTGVRLIGPKPQWARKDGGEAGLHPSNIHDNAYAIGAVDFTGDMPVILGPDGPSLGGFVCPATVVQAELWKLGQLRPGDTVRFQRLSQGEAERLEAVQDAAIAALAPPPVTASARAAAEPPAEAVLHRIPETENPVAVVYRRAGDKYLLVEYGPLVLDLNLRFRVHALMTHLQREAIPGILDLTPGIRSLQVHYDSRVLPLAKLMDLLLAAEKRLPAIEDMEVPARIVHLPLSWDDAATRLAIEKYMQSVRKDAPWCPSNIEFIRRINGLDSIEDVKRIVFEASYLVLGLGDVYLGAPVATPIDPRHRLVTTKYNPARTWTPENAVGIGGAYLCIYGMEGPGGYQFVGRTLQMWNRWRQTDAFTGGKPWLLRFFDQIRFYPVSESELLKIREDFPLGRYPLRIEETTFRLREYNAFLRENAASIAAFKAKQQAAFEAERERWRQSGQADYATDLTVAEAAPDSELDLPDNGRAVASEVAGSVWKVHVQEGAEVKRGDTLIVIESMKMEFAVLAPCDGRVYRVYCREGGQVAAGQDLLVLVSA